MLHPQFPGVNTRKSNVNNVFISSAKLLLKTWLIIVWVLYVKIYTTFSWVENQKRISPEKLCSFLSDKNYNNWCFPFWNLVQVCVCVCVCVCVYVCVCACACALGHTAQLAGS